jgi:hypothetical protein
VPLRSGRTIMPSSAISRFGWVAPLQPTHVRHGIYKTARSAKSWMRAVPAGSIARTPEFVTGKSAH